MPKSLSDLRADPPKSFSERSLTICLAPHLVAEVQALTEELESLPAPRPADDDEDSDAPVRKMGQGEPPRAAEIRARLRELLDEMAEREGEIRLRLADEGEWRRWVDKHPAREEGQPGHRRDVEVTIGYCNADALLDTLGTYVYSWNGEPLAPGDWDAIFKDNIAGPDKKKMATAVVAMGENGLDLPKWRAGLSDSLSRLNGSGLPAASASVPVVSTDGNPAPSSEATTETASE